MLARNSHSTFGPICHRNPRRRTASQWRKRDRTITDLREDRSYIHPHQSLLSSLYLIQERRLRSLGMWHVLSFSRITIGLLRRRSDRPVIGGDLADAHVPPGWGESILMCSQLTLGSTQPGEKPVTVHSGDASSTQQHVLLHQRTRHWREDKEQSPLISLTSSFHLHRDSILTWPTKLFPSPFCSLPTSANINS